jgi:hypothetical protein
LSVLHCQGRLSGRSEDCEEPGNSGTDSPTQSNFTEFIKLADP